MVKKMITLIMPDQGKIYGFPKIFPDYTGNVPVWLVENGYPKKLVNYWVDRNLTIPYKLWQVPEDEVDKYLEELGDSRVECDFGLYR